MKESSSSKTKSASRGAARTHHSPQKHQSSLVDPSDIPSHYDVTRLVLMPRDPLWIFAYWEMSGSAIENAKKSLGSDFNKSTLTIRMYDVTCIDFNGLNANHSFDIEVSATTNNWYIHLWRDNVSYCADLGFRSPQGHFFQIARSNFITTPSAHIRDKYDEVWMQVRQDYKEPPVVSKSDPAESRHKTPRSMISQKAKNRRIYLSEAEVRSYYANIYPLARKADAKREKIFRFESFPEKKQSHFETLETPETAKGKVLEKIGLGASEELIFPGASENQFVSSGAQAQTGKQKDDFYFEIGTELVVYGRTLPDAEVWLENRKIPLKKDGTFSIRFALPDGKIPLGFKAISCNKEHIRKILTKVKRSPTDYSKQ